MSIIDVEHLTKDYGSGRGVFDVSIHVNEGEVLAFWDLMVQENQQRFAI